MAEHHFHTYEDGPRWARGFVQSDGVMPMSKGWELYRRFSAEPLVEITDLYGQTRWMTTRQMKVLIECERLITINDSTTTMRQIALDLAMSASTVSRTMRKLAAWGRICYSMSRGRYGGITIMSRARGDSFERYAIAAREAIRRAYERAKARFRARLEASGYPISNVASISEGGVDRSSGHYLHSTYVMDATLKRDELIKRDHELARFLGCVDPKKRVPCPVHGTKDRNLSWAWGRNGRLLVKCWSHQCTYDEIRAAAHA